jgi:hypothetical protein
MAPEAGSAPAPFNLTNWRTTVIPLWNEIGQGSPFCPACLEFPKFADYYLPQP